VASQARCISGSGIPVVVARQPVSNVNLERCRRRGLIKVNEPMLARSSSGKRATMKGNTSAPKEQPGVWVRRHETR
jgi:hypothetical protein